MRIFSYVREVYDLSCTASFSRWATTATVATGCWSLVHLVRHNNALPDPTVLAALAVWMTAPYGINKVAAVLTAKPAASDPPA